MRVIKIMNNIVTEVKQMLPHYKLKENEMFSSIGEHGQVYNPEDGTFSDYAPSQEELAEQEKQSRIIELEKLIERGQKVGDDVTKYQQELKSLYDGVHDEYITTKEQEAIDAYTLELIEGGLL